MGNKHLVLLVFIVVCVSEGCNCITVTYDHRALVIDGKRRVLQSGSIHYPRSMPEVSSIPYSFCGIHSNAVPDDSLDCG